MGMKEILLAKGEKALVDDEDFDRVRVHKWWLLRTKSGKLYAYRPATRDDGGHTSVLMHRFIVGAQSRQIVDHEDGNGLNNTRKNLRVCTPTQNNANRKKYGEYSSKYKGVSLNKSKGKWQAFIKAGGKSEFLGYFSDEVEAARAYDAAAMRMFGQFARPNFPQEQK